jgi:hypothetical protein
MHKSKSQPTSQARGAARFGREQATATHAVSQERTSRSPRLKNHRPDLSTAVERKNDTGPQRETIERQPAVREEVQERPAVTPASQADARPSGTPPDHPNETDAYEALLKALGTRDRNVAKGLFGQLLDASAGGPDKFDGDGLFFMLGVIKGAKLRDSSDAMLVAQMAAVHMATMQLSGQLARADNLAQQESAARALNQLSRTFTAQYEAFKRSCAGGEPKLAVQNVSVNQGAQAIVTNVTHATHGAVPEELAKTTPPIFGLRESAPAPRRA